jgi:serine/threonine-protein kinase ULK2
MKGTVGNYRLDKKLGQGAYGQVYSATHTGTNERYAIKMLSKSACMASQKTQNSLKMEINTMKVFNHQNIVSCREAFYSGVYVCVVLELCSGGDLKEFIHRSPTKCLSESQALHFLLQILDGMIVLHRNNCLHRDLKIANVLIKETCPTPYDYTQSVFPLTLKIADFGFARLIDVDNHNLAETQLGTPFYMVKTSSIKYYYFFTNINSLFF